VNDILGLQRDFKKLFEWSEDWLMLFNLDKCKMMHIGYNNPRVMYDMSSQIIEVVEEEKD
jgi:hypothetical protein